MRRWLPLFALVTLAVLAGCNGSAPYAAVMQEQITTMQEMTNIFKSVTDEPSMAAARVKLQKLYQRAQQIAVKAKALPPPPEEARQQIQKELGPQMQQSFDNRQREIGRILELPNGKEFLEGLGKAP
jgi:hypothetical protein